MDLTANTCVAMAGTEQAALGSGGCARITWAPPLSDMREVRRSSEAHTRGACAAGGGRGGGGRVRGAARAAR